MLLIASAIVLLLIVLNGVFAMSELAVVSSRRTRLQSLAERGDKGAAAALRLADEPTRFLSAVQVGITLIGIFAGAFGQATIAAELDALLEAVPGLAAYSEAIATGVVVVVLTYLSLIVGELVPKRVALLFPEAIAARRQARGLNSVDRASSLEGNLRWGGWRTGTGRETAPCGSITSPCRRTISRRRSRSTRRSAFS